MSINTKILLFTDTILLTLVLGLLLPSIVIFVESIIALLPRRGKAEHLEGHRPKVAVLVPAHNEEDLIGETLRTILPQLTEQDRLVVIADNCSDRTAAVARQFGVTVIERLESDRSKRGKGYALDYGLKFLEKDPPEVVVTVDADCVVHQGTIDRIAKLAAFGRPVQSTYIMSQPENPELKDLISALAIKFKNLVRPAGLACLGLPCLLTGSGMALPWSVIRKVSLAGSKTADDMQLAIDLVLAGHPPRFCQDALVTGRLMKQQAAQSQRTRWEHGHLEILLTEVPKLIKQYFYQQRFDLLAMALDLCVPPLSLLVIIWASVMGIAVIAFSFGSSLMPIILLMVEGLLIFISIIAAWAKFGRADLPVLKLLAVPFYILWKTPIYLAFLVQPQTKWVRTERDIVITSNS